MTAKKIIGIFSLSLSLNFMCAQNAVSYYNQALAELSYGNNSQAMEKINKAIELKPDYADALSYRGYFNHLNKNYDKAIADYLAADKLKHNVNGYFIASSYALAGNKAEALKWLETSLGMEYNRAQLPSILNDPDLTSLQSEPKWKEITTKDWYTPYEKLITEGNALTGKKDLMGALEAWNKAIALEPSKDEAYGQRAINYLYQGNMEKAIADVTKAISLNGTKSVYYGNRAYFYKEMKMYKEALADYDKAEQLDPQNIIYGDRAMVRYIVNQKDPGVATDLKNYLAINYKDDFNFYLLGLYYYGVSNDADAISALNKAILLKGDESSYYKKRGQAYFGQKDYPNATSDLDKAIALKSDDGEAWYLRGVVFGEQKKKDDACRDWKKARELGYDDQNGYYNAICR
jgi:tetratricopeptide (TPR) repeat protein